MRALFVGHRGLIVLGALGRGYRGSPRGSTGGAVGPICQQIHV